MRRNSLSSKGLSMSQAQSISNLCNQRSRDISFKLADINNISKKIKIGEDEFVEVEASPIPENLSDLLSKKSALHATQSFLMENIKAKNEMLDEIKWREFEFDKDSPVKPTLKSLKNESEVDEKWGWSKLSVAEYNEYLEAEAFASHVGQFIHKGGKLDQLRTELPSIKKLEWMEIETGKKTPVKVEIHHTSEELGKIHESLATIHREYEQRVNYFKAKVKNLVTSENARIAKENAIKQTEVKEANDNLLDAYNKEMESYRSSYREASNLFEENRQKEIATASALRIDVDSRFQPIIDMFLKEVSKDTE
jgi:hypothetical protein